MTRTQLERKYEDCGLNDYQLRTLDELKEIHGVDVRDLSGYSGLTEENKKLFDMTVLHFYNAHGLDSRKQLLPKSVNYVIETEYVKDIDETEAETAGIVIDSIDRSGKKRRLHRYVFNKNIPFSECRKEIKKYLRFELKGVWYHFMDKGKWY